LGSLGGTLIAALGLTSIEGMMSAVLNPIQSKAAILVVMVVILMIRPRGLFGEREG
jgi:branched-chain amino acid transport system permease protein